MFFKDNFYLKKQAQLKLSDILSNSFTLQRI